MTKLIIIMVASLLVFIEQMVQWQGWSRSVTQGKRQAVVLSSPMRLSNAHTSCWLQATSASKFT